MPSVLTVFFSRRMLLIFVMGFSSGLPLALTGATLQAWLADSEVTLQQIGLLALPTYPYALKFLWAPFADRFALTPLGRRRSWLLLSQLALIVLLVLIGFVDPRTELLLLALLSLAIAFASATQDIAIDAYRREVLQEEELGAGVSVATLGYRIGMLTSGAAALALSDHYSWPAVYRIMAAYLLLGIGATLAAPEPQGRVSGAKGIRSFIAPFQEYISRSHAWEVLAFILLYKIGDVLAGALSTPFLKELGFSNTEIAAVLKGVGLAATISGGLAGGALMIRLGLRRGLIWFGLVQAASIAAYAALALVGKSLFFMIAAVAIENFGAGLGTAAFLAFLMALCAREHTATQYALFSSITAVLRPLIVPLSAFLVGAIGWFAFFTLGVLASLPALAMVLVRYRRWTESGTLQLQR